MQSLPHPHTLVLPVGRALIDGPAQFVPLAAARVRLGFPSPADDFMDEAIDLHRLLVRNPAATFLCRADGRSMSAPGSAMGGREPARRHVAAAAREAHGASLGQPRLPAHGARAIHRG